MNSTKPKRPLSAYNLIYYRFVILSNLLLWQSFCSAIPVEFLQSLGKQHHAKHHHASRNARRTTSDHGECRLPKEADDASFINITTQTTKALKICDVLGGLDITRLYSLDTRSLFREAIEDVELVREYMTEAIISGAREFAPVLEDLANSLDFESRANNLTAADTTVTAGLAWVDDKIDRRMERYVSESKNMPHNGDKASDAAMIDSATDIMPWLVDRKSRETKWNICHRNGRSEGAEKMPLPFDNLYAAGYVLSWGDSLWYYPPLQLYGHPFNMADLQGNEFDSREMVSEAYFTAENGGKPRDSFFYGPYADALDPTGRAMITAVSFVYYNGTFRGLEYNDDYIAHLGFDILLTSVSEWLSGLEGTLAPGSFAFLVDSSTFKAITISQNVVEKIYPERTGMEEHRLFDVQGKPVGIDRRNQTYQVGDTIHESVINLGNADWAELQKAVLGTPRGERGYEEMGIILTGQEVATPHYILYDRWGYTSDWTLLVAVPKAELDTAIKVTLSHDLHNINYEKGDDGLAYGNFFVENTGTLDVVILPRTLASWIEFAGESKSVAEGGAGYSLPAGSSVIIEYEIHADKMESGTSSSTISVQIVDDNYPDCFHDTDLAFNVAVRVSEPGNDNHIGKTAAFGWTLAVVVMVASASCAGWTIINKNTGVVRASQPLFLVLICIGTGVMGSAMIPLGFDDGNASEAGANTACMAVPWLASLGFTVSFAAILSKIWRMNQIFQAAKRFSRVKVTERDVMKPFVVLFGLNFALLLAWSLVDPLRFVRLSADDNSVATATDVETYGACRSENKGLQAFGIPILVVNIGALILACIQAYRARGISDEYSESKYLAIAVGSWFEVVLVGIPLLVIVDRNPTASYLLKSSMIFIVSMSLLLLIYIPKLFVMRKKRNANNGEAKNYSLTNQQSSASSAGVGLRIVSVAFEAEDESVTMLKDELAACKKRLHQLEQVQSTCNAGTTSEDNLESKEDDAVDDV